MAPPLLFANYLLILFLIFFERRIRFKRPTCKILYGYTIEEDFSYHKNDYLRPSSHNSQLISLLFSLDPFFSLVKSQ